MALVPLVLKLRKWEPGRLPEILSACGAERLPDKVVPQIRWARALADEAEVDAALAALNAHPNVESGSATVEPAMRARWAAVLNAPSADSDSHLNQQWWHVRIGTFRAWRFTKGDPAVKIGSFDSGIIYGLAEVPVDYSKTWSSYYERGGFGWIDDYEYANGSGWAGHGSGVYSVMSSPSGNGLYGTGVAPLCSHYVTTAHNMDNGIMLALDIAEALTWHADQGVSALNWSGGADANDPEIQVIKNALAYCWTNGCVVVAAAGNGYITLDGKDLVPPNQPNVIVVGAVYADDTPTAFTNYGAAVTICAPGHDVWNFGNLNTWHASEGTSFSAPQVTAAIGDIKSVDPTLTTAEAVALLYATMDAPRNPVEFYAKFPNAGMLSVGRAVSAAHSRYTSSVVPYFDAHGAGTAFAFSGGVPTLTLDGEVKIDLSGYTSGVECPRVALLLDGRTLYDGPPTRLNATASSSGTALPLTVRAYAADGVTYSEETYTDVVVASLALETEIQGSPLDAAIALLTGSAAAENFSRFVLPGPLKIWNGTALVDAPLRLFDGSSLS